MRVRRRFPYIGFDRPVTPPKPSVTELAIAVSFTVDDESADRAIERLDEVTAAADDALQALENLSRAELAHEIGFVPCVVCGEWRDPDDLWPDGTCPHCIR